MHATIPMHDVTNKDVNECSYKYNHVTIYMTGFEKSRIPRTIIII